jgi:hypothetical protein
VLWPELAAEPAASLTHVLLPPTCPVDLQVVFVWKEELEGRRNVVLKKGLVYMMLAAGMSSHRKATIKLLSIDSSLLQEHSGNIILTRTFD